MASQENILTLEPVEEVSYEEQSRPDVIGALVTEPFTDSQDTDSPKEMPSAEGNVVSGSMTFSPRTGTYNVNEPAFVPDGFHENRCPETRGLKVTEENKGRLSNLEFLRGKHAEGWATEEGVTYTPEMTGCKPTDSELISLSLEGLKFRGRVVTDEGAVHDFDTQQELAEITGHSEIENAIQRFKEREYHLSQDINVFDKLSSQYNVAKCNGAPCSPTYYITEPNGHVRQVPPAGVYERHEHKGKVNADGIPIVTICDIPEDCCRMNHLMYGLASTGTLPSENQDQIMNYFRDRSMYRHNDNVYGHFDICYYCLMRRGTPE